MGSRQERVSKLSALFRSLRSLDFFGDTSKNSRNQREKSKLEMARLVAILCLASVALAQDRYWGSYSASYPAGGGGNSGSVAESRATLERAQFGNFNPQPRTPAPRRAPVAAPRRAPPAPRAPVVPRVVEKSIYSTEDVEPGQYVHNPEWDLTPYQLWKRKQAAKKGLQANANSIPEPARKVVTVRKQFAKSLLSEKIRSRFKTHSGLESLQRSVDPSLLPAEYGGKTSVAECITSWKKELEAGREELLELDQLKVDSSAPVGEQLALVRKKSRHDSGSGSEVLSMMGNMRKHEAEP